MTNFPIGLARSFSAGALLQAIGWPTFDMLLLPRLAITALASNRLGHRQRRHLEPTVAESPLREGAPS